MTSRSVHGLMLALALILTVASVALFIASSVSSTNGSWVTLVGLGSATGAGAFAFFAGYLTVRALPAS